MSEYKHSSNRSDWISPPHIIEAAREVMGSIDLDPASSAKANQVVQAKEFYNERRNGLVKPWFGNVWLNPPFGKIIIGGKERSSQDVWVQKACKEWSIEDEYGPCVQQMTTIFNQAMSQVWFRPLLDQLLCVPYGRLSFIDPDTLQPMKSNQYGSVIVYWSRDKEQAVRFKKRFKQYGAILRRWK